jgi:glycosyltransferase involved in cell wall biosynthesis
VELLPDVPDVRPHLAAATVVVAPVRFGTGMRGKVLEALAMGRPLVTTTLGAEGLGARGDDVLLVADDAPAFAAALARVLDDPARAARLAAGGRAHVAARFGWDAIADAHDAIYDAVPTTPRAPAPAPRPVDGGPLRGWPGLAAGAALLGVRGVAWHLRRLAA